MTEFWDIYDENRNKTGNLAKRDGYEELLGRNMEDYGNVMVVQY